MGRKRKGKKRIFMIDKRANGKPRSVGQVSARRVVTEEVKLDVSPLLLEVWRTNMRVERDGAAESVKLACERMLDACRELGIRFETYIGQPYDENLRLEVVEHKVGKGDRMIDACLSPAVFMDGRLVKMAQVTTLGERK